jgi:hypothetical protein
MIDPPIPREAPRSRGTIPPGDAPSPTRSTASRARRSAALIAFLVTPRTSADLAAWASERGMSPVRLRKLVAALADEEPLAERARTA